MHVVFNERQHRRAPDVAQTSFRERGPQAYVVVSHAEMFLGPTIGKIRSVNQFLRQPAHAGFDSGLKGGHLDGVPCFGPAALQLLH